MSNHKPIKPAAVDSTVLNKCGPDVSRLAPVTVYTPLAAIQQMYDYFSD